MMKPFIKWAGGKGQLWEQLAARLPQEIYRGKIKTYIEPFLGGGAMFFALAQRFRFQQVYLSDSNQDLVLAYQMVQQNPANLIEILREMQRQYNATAGEDRNALFLSIRADFNARKNADSKEDKISRAAQFIFLNKTCFNGLFRLNSKGNFNVPFGKYKSPNILDEANIRAVSKGLQGVEILHSDYAHCFDKADVDTFVYFDPPYRPLSPTANFTTYTGSNFGDEEQKKLAVFFRKLDKERGAKLMLSNADPTNTNPEDTFFNDIYEGYHLHKVLAGRAINSDGNKRGKITELLILNYIYESIDLGSNI